MSPDLMDGDAPLGPEDCSVFQVVTRQHLLNEPVADTYKAYADAGATFEQIVDVEKRAFGLRVIGDGQLSIARKMVSAGRDHESNRTLAVYLREDRDGNRA